jgi:hypothetical protein
LTFSARPRLLALPLLMSLAFLGAACGAVRPPVRSPLEDPASVAASSVPLPTASVPVPGATSAAGDTAPSQAEVEPASARASALMAEWLAVPPRELTVVTAEAVVWPSACLGVTLPGMGCADRLTPGFRIVLRDGFGVTHEVHAAVAGGDARWTGQVTATGVLTSLDRGAQRAVVTVAGKALTLRVAPGTLVLPAARAGAGVVVAYDPGASGSALPTAAWIGPAS